MVDCLFFLSQATRCVQELEVPHFYHELVYEVLWLLLIMELLHMLLFIQPYTFNEYSQCSAAKDTCCT